MRLGFQAAVGLIIGAVLLWLAFRGVAVAEIRSLLAAVRPEWVGVALALYAGDLLLRAIRWHALLSELVPVSRAKVGEALLVGYAFNNLLPARLGELFRADYAKRRFGISRSAALGSIVVERLLDGSAMVACLAGGLFAISAAQHTPLTGGNLGALRLISVTGVGAMAVLLLGAGCMVWLRHGAIRLLPTLVQRPLASLGDGLRTLNRASAVKVLVLSAGAWLLEVASLWSVARSVNADLTFVQALVLLGAVSLSTLVPTAPGYLGSYQFVFALTLSAFSFSEAAGVVAASITQVFLLGAITVTGLALYTLRSVHQLVRREDGGASAPLRPCGLAAKDDTGLAARATTGSRAGQLDA